MGHNNLHRSLLRRRSHHFLHTLYNFPLARLCRHFLQYRNLRGSHIQVDILARHLY